MAPKSASMAAKAKAMASAPRRSQKATGPAPERAEAAERPGPPKPMREGPEPGWGLVSQTRTHGLLLAQTWPPVANERMQKKMW